MVASYRGSLDIDARHILLGIVIAGQRLSQRHNRDLNTASSTNAPIISSIVPYIVFTLFPDPLPSTYTCCLPLLHAPPARCYKKYPSFLFYQLAIPLLS